MFTKINTKNLQKIYNPFKDGVFYKNENIQISLSDINHAIKYLDKIENLNQEHDLKTEFCLNFVMYMYNSNSPKFITIDFNKENTPIVNGVFELIKNIYNKEKETFISIINNIENNDVFIKTQKLEPVYEKFEHAYDKTFHNLKGDFHQHNEVVQDDRFFWKGEVINDFNIYEKLKSILNLDLDKHSLKNKIYDLFKLYPEQINTDEFKIFFLSEVNPNLDLRDYFNDDLDFLPKFSKENILEAIKIDFKSPNINFTDPLFLNFFIPYDYYPCNIKEIFTKEEKLTFLNSDVIINFFNERNKRNSEYLLKNIYQNFNVENQKKNINKFIEINIQHSYQSGEKWFDSEIFLAKPEVLTDKEVFSKILPLLNIKDFKKYLDKHKYKFDLLDNLDYILSQSIKSDRIFTLIHTFDIDINQDDLKKIINKDINSIVYLMRNYQYFPNHEIETLIPNIIKEKNINIFNVVNLHEIQKIDPEFVEKLLVNQDTSSTQLNNFLNKLYFLYYDLINTKDKDVELIKKRFNTLENSFITKKYKWNNNGLNINISKELKKITEKDTFDLLDNIKQNIIILNNDERFVFNSKNFYKNLNPKIKNNPDIILKIIEIHPLPYDILPPSLKLNFDFNINLIKLNDLYINSIPTELYNNKDFSLKIAKTIDEKPNIKKELPNFVQLFFSKINSNYYDYLNSHILYHNLQNKVEKTTTKAPIKKI